MLAISFQMRILSVLSARYPCSFTALFCTFATYRPSTFFANLCTTNSISALCFGGHTLMSSIAEPNLCFEKSQQSNNKFPSRQSATRFTRYPSSKDIFPLMHKSHLHFRISNPHIPDLYIVSPFKIPYISEMLLL